MRNSNAWIWWVLLAVVVVAIAIWALTSTSPSSMGTTTASSTALSGNTSETTFYCDGGSSIDATFGESSVSLALSDGRTMTLPQTTSGSGIRYEATSTNSDIVFSSEGQSASLMENNKTTFSDCTAARITTSATNNGFKSYVDYGGTFSFNYPNSFIILGIAPGYTTSWMNNATTTGLLLAAVDLPGTAMPKTNFGDAKFTVGTSADPSAVAECLSYNPTGGPKTTPTQSTIDGITYTVFTSSDAGAGNLYNTTSYRTIHNGQCYALEFTVHSTQLANYPAGTVTAFNQTSVTNDMNAIIQSFKFLK